jgi:hypothetical protein
MPYDSITDQLKQMEAERKLLVARVKEATGFENEQAMAILKAHDIEVGKLLGFPATE